VFIVVNCSIGDKINLNNMGFLKKFKKLIFSRKRDKRREKGEKCDHDENHCQEAETLRKRVIELQEQILICHEDRLICERTEKDLRGQIKDLNTQIARMESRQLEDHQEEEADEDEEEEEGDVASVRDPFRIVISVYKQLQEVLKFWRLVRFLYTFIHYTYVLIRSFFQTNEV